jgi:internalin A
MADFNWLQITDIHCGQGGQIALWPNIRERFLQDVTALQKRIGRFHAIFITGDVTQSGLAAEFAEFDENVLEPLLTHLARSQGTRPSVLAVPGNHDLVRPTTKPRSAALRQLARPGGYAEVSEEFWTDSDSEYGKLVRDCFANYQKWHSRVVDLNGCELTNGPLSGDFAATIKVSSEGNGSQIKIGVVGVNSAFLQMEGGDYRQRLHMHPRQLHDVCGGDVPRWVASHDACLLLSHHGPEWLDQACRDSTYPEIYPGGRFVVHLFGHMHESAVRTTYQGGGLPIRQWQGRSLFGLARFADAQSPSRTHGYSAGQIRFDDDTTVRHWPRRAYFDSNGWRFEPDLESCKLRTEDGGTEADVVRGSELCSTEREFGRPEEGKRTDAVSVHRLPSNSRWPWLATETSLRAYCEAICAAHSHIRFVEIPYLKEFSDVQLDKLYVEPRFSRSQIHPDTDPGTWGECLGAIEALKSAKSLVLLGDPGSGKSTLVSCISWQLCRPSPPPQNAWTQWLGGHCPLPIILRELKLTTDITWEGLLDQFLKHRIGRQLPSRAAVEAMLKHGRAIVLLDGLDEIGNLTVRRRLRDAVHAGIAANPEARWILTSRMVGYDTVPFHLRTEKIAVEELTDAEIVAIGKKSKTIQTQVADLLYLSPFNDEQISEFSKNWYLQHETDKNLVAQSSENFVSAIRENDGTQRLARIPYLLTLMALIHHKSATLPHGRTELYDRIAAAYLESIDLRRQLDQLPYSLSQKKRWLAYIAYQMQLQRGAGQQGPNHSQILASKSDVRQWLRKAMEESSAVVGSAEVNGLIEYFAARSGLLLPRAEGMFAFMHLSLQEYFAACFVEPKLTASRFAPKRQKAQPSDSQLRAWANDQAWREAYILLFELLTQKSLVETEGFLVHLFENKIDQDSTGSLAVAAGLLAEVCTDPFVTLGVETRRRYLQKVWRWVLRQRFRRSPRQRYSATAGMVRTLVRDSRGDLQSCWKSASITRQELKDVEVMDLSGCSTLSDLSPLSLMPNLRGLDLAGCISAKNGWDVLRSLKRLEFIDLSGCAVSPDVFSDVGKLPELRVLLVSSPFDLNVLSGAETLHELHLHCDLPETVDFAPLAQLEELQFLCTATDPGKIQVSLSDSGEPRTIASPGLMSLLKRGMSESGGLTRSRRRVVGERK